jgi:hypothetical protein
VLRSAGALIVLLVLGTLPAANLVCAWMCASHRQAATAERPHHCDTLPPAPVAVKSEHCPDVEVHGPPTAIGIVTASASLASGPDLPASPVFVTGSAKFTDHAAAASPPRPQRPLALRI